MVPKYQIYDTEHQVVLSRTEMEQYVEYARQVGDIWIACNRFSGWVLNAEEWTNELAQDFARHVAATVGYDRRTLEQVMEAQKK